MNGETQSITAAITNSFTGLWQRIIDFLPELLAALLIVVLGIIVAKVVANIVRKILAWTQIDTVGKEMGLHKYLKEKDINFSFSNSIAWLAKWFVLLAFFVAAIDILGIPQMSNFINSLIAYIPNVILAVIILSVGFIAAHYLRNLVEKSADMSRSLNNYSSQLGLLASGSLIAFALMAALIQLGIAASLIQIMFAGLIGMLALAGGLAFGLGGRRSARQFLERFQLESAESSTLYMTEEIQETIREDVPNCLVGLDFPADKKEIVKYCGDSKPKNLLKNLRDRKYTSLSDIIGGLRGSLST